MKFRFATTPQLARLDHQRYGSRGSALRQTTRHLASLETAGLVLRLERRVGGWPGGSGPAVWALTTSGYHQITGTTGARQRPRLLSTTFLEHLLAVTETRVIVAETVREIDGASVHVEHEPECWRTYLGLHGQRLTLRPDLRLEITTQEFRDSYFLEVDRATENPARVIAKCRQYQRYRRTGQEQQRAGAFPAVLWIVPHTKRRDQLNQHIRQAELTSGMFHVRTLDELPTILRDGPPTSTTHP
ncbi:replication-relaxation family protein [Pseudoclavibacter sp. AY1F1]|uniref:replication-relaxation family protein n=1 Tax=Pseudoclavibacter sp. AY1F1 TaxID=2080583 RepID=UPI001C665FAA|nr:replication-relaxation family protein [Pseudoclavibacter sp. AY1F1]